MSRPGGVRIFLGGEGRNELGGRAHHPSFPSEERGVIEALLRRVKDDGWSVGGSRNWKDIRKLKVGQFRDADTRNVLGLCLHATEACCHIVAFTRDEDGQGARADAIERGIEEARAGSSLRIIGAVAVRKLESWILALLGKSKTESFGNNRIQQELVMAEVKEKDTAAMVAVVEVANLDQLPTDATSLRLWLDRARAALDEHLPDEPPR